MLTEKGIMQDKMETPSELALYCSFDAGALVMHKYVIDCDYQGLCSITIK